MSDNFEKWSDNIHNLMARTVKRLILCSILGLVWGLAEMDRETGGRERRKSDGEGEMG